MAGATAQWLVPWPWPHLPRHPSRPSCKHFMQGHVRTNAAAWAVRPSDWSLCGERGPRAKLVHAEWVWPRQMCRTDDAATRRLLLTPLIGSQQEAVGRLAHVPAAGRRCTAHTGLDCCSFAARQLRRARDMRQRHVCATLVSDACSFTECVSLLMGSLRGGRRVPRPSAIRATTAASITAVAASELRRPPSPPPSASLFPPRPWRRSVPALRRAAVCSGHGACRADGTCACEPGWTGGGCDGRECALRA